MKTIVQLLLVSMLIIAAVPAYSAEVSQIFRCEQDEDATRMDLEAAASEWLKAARQMKGGDEIEVYLYFPIAAQMGEYDFYFVLKAPSLEKWGVFMDGYEGSPAQKVDKKFDELCDCPDSALFEAVKEK